MKTLLVVTASAVLSLFGYSYHSSKPAHNGPVVVVLSGDPVPLCPARKCPNLPVPR